MCYWSERGEHNQQPHKWVTGWDPATWPSPSGFYGAGMSGLVDSPLSFNLSDYMDISTQPNTQLNSGTPSTAPAAAGSAAQLQLQTEMDSACDDVMEHEPGP